MTTRSMAAWAAAAMLVACIGIAVAAARHAHPAEVSPVVPSGSWNDAWIAAVVAAFVLYCVAVVAFARVRAHWGAALVIAAVLQALPVAAPLLLSKDVYLYWSEARIVTVHHASPYRSTPSDYPSDLALPYVSEEWRTSKAPYGPAWEALALAPAAASSTARNAASAYRVLAIVGVLLAAAIVALRTRSAAAVALLGWNPVVALHFGGGGHSDGWLMALVVAGVVGASLARGGAAWSLAAAFKPVPLVLLPLDLAADRIRRPRRFWLGLIACGIAVLVVSGAVWGFGWVRASLVGVHGASPFGGVHWLTEAGLSHHDAVAVAGLVFAIVYCALLVRAWRSGVAHLALAASALCLTTSLLRPWYAIWPLALAAVEEDALGAAAAVALSAYLLLGDAVSL
jgi:hypothetical protein